VEHKERKEVLSTLTDRQVLAIKEYFDRAASPEMFMLINEETPNMVYQMGKARGAIMASRGLLRVIGSAKKKASSSGSDGIPA